MRTCALLLVFAVACGSVRDRSECATSPECPAGQYCAQTADGNVCWPDALAPTLSAVVVACDSTPCLRSGVLHVTATIADDAEVLGAEVTLDVGGPATPMTRSGADWVADLPLRRFPFEHFVHGVVARVTARDGARNEASLDASAATTVTRLRFEKVLEDGVELTSPVVVADESVAGAATIAVAGANHRAYFVGWDGNGLASVAVGTLKISAAPLALGTSVWIGSEDGKVYEVTNGGGAFWQPNFRCDTTRPVRGSLAATKTGRVVATSNSGSVFTATSAGCGPSASKRGLPFSLGPVVDSADSIYAVAETFVRRLTVDELGFIDDDPAFTATTLPWAAVEPVALDSSLFVPTGLGAQGQLYRIDAADAEPQQLATTSLPSSGFAILAEGSILVPERNETLTCWSPNAAELPYWRSPVLDGAPRTPLVTSSVSTPFIVSTDAGAVHALRPGGTIAWSGKLSAGTAALQPGNIYTPPGQPADAVLSTAYFAGADGVLHAVIVDGALDGAAPWPKAFHDPRNTNRAGPQP